MGHHSQPREAVSMAGGQGRHTAHGERRGLAERGSLARQFL